MLSAQLNLTRQFASISSSAGISRWKKIIRTTADGIFGVLNDEFMAGLL